MGTGKVILGARKTIRELKMGKIKMVVLSANCPREFEDDVAYYASLSKVPVLKLDKTNVELGRLCGKPFIVSVLGIQSFGDSRISELAKGGKPRRSSGSRKRS